MGLRMLSKFIKPRLDTTNYSFMFVSKTTNMAVAQGNCDKHFHELSDGSKHRPCAAMIHRLVGYRKYSVHQLLARRDDIPLRIVGS